MKTGGMRPPMHHARTATRVRLAVLIICLAITSSIHAQRDVNELRMLAEQGEPAAQFNLGRLYVTGTGVPQDDAAAVRWYRLAAEQGHAGAQHNLGVKYDSGVGVPEDDTAAAHWYRLAGDQGHWEAQFRLGRMYDNATGVSRDDAEAARWYRMAADQGHAGSAVQSRPDVLQRTRRETEPRGGRALGPSGSSTGQPDGAGHPREHV